MYMFLFVFSYFVLSNKTEICCFFSSDKHNLIIKFITFTHLESCDDDLSLFQCERFSSYFLRHCCCVLANPCGASWSCRLEPLDRCLHRCCSWFVSCDSQRAKLPSNQVVNQRNCFGIR